MLLSCPLKLVLLSANSGILENQVSYELAKDGDTVNGQNILRFLVQFMSFVFFFIAHYLTQGPDNRFLRCQKIF